MSILTIHIGDQHYTKDPQSSELGKKIVSEGIQMLDELGFEQFTFKKLALRINSTEASVYRYFDNKLTLLVYLTTWYWAWIEYLIDYRTHHLEDNEEILEEILMILCHVDNQGDTPDVADMNIDSLRRVVMSESDKTYLTKQVDEINSLGLFKGFKTLCHKISLVILAINPAYPYPHSIVTTIMEAAHQQTFFALHLPSLTEVSQENSSTVEQQVYAFLHTSLIKLIK